MLVKLDGVYPDYSVGLHSLWCSLTLLLAPEKCFCFILIIQFCLPDSLICSLLVLLSSYMRKPQFLVSKKPLFYVRAGLKPASLEVSSSTEERLRIKRALFYSTDGLPMHILNHVTNSVGFAVSKTATFKWVSDYTHTDTYQPYYQASGLEYFRY